MIYRLSISAERDRFLLKGALLFDLWFHVLHRPTHDADFLGFGSAEIPQVEAVFRDICRIEVDDGIVFDPDSVKAAEIRKDANYAGIRVTLLGMLDKARCPVQADIGFGDAVVPGPDEVDYPVLLADMPAGLIEWAVIVSAGHSRRPIHCLLTIYYYNAMYEGATAGQDQRSPGRRHDHRDRDLGGPDAGSTV